MKVNAMQRYGYLTQDSQTKKITGRIVCRHLKADIVLDAVPNKRSDRAADFKVVDKDGFDLGAAWEKAKRETGEMFLTLTLDDPAFPAPLNLTAFQSEPGRFDVMWQRPRQDGQGQG